MYVNLEDGELARRGTVLSGDRHLVKAEQVEDLLTNVEDVRVKYFT
jgi:hypothetical protein